jgi:hypothetical protein
MAYERSPDGSGSHPSGRAAGGVSPVPASIPNASRFINWIADRFQAAHVPPLPRDRAVSMAVGTLEWFEEDMPFGDPRGAWDEDGAHELADADISYWEAAA